jgi:hypothetical protein
MGGFVAVDSFLGEHLAEQAEGGASPCGGNKDGTPRHLFPVSKGGVIRFFASFWLPEKIVIIH